MNFETDNHSSLLQSDVWPSSSNYLDNNRMLLLPHQSVASPFQEFNIDNHMPCNDLIDLSYVIPHTSLSNDRHYSGLVYPSLRDICPIQLDENEKRFAQCSDKDFCEIKNTFIGSEKNNAHYPLDNVLSRQSDDNTHMYDISQFRRLQELELQKHEQSFERKPVAFHNSSYTPCQNFASLDSYYMASTYYNHEMEIGRSPLPFDSAEYCQTCPYSSTKCCLTDPECHYNKLCIDLRKTDKIEASVLNEANEDGNCSHRYMMPIDDKTLHSPNKHVSFHTSNSSSNYSDQQSYLPCSSLSFSITNELDLPCMADFSIQMTTRKVPNMASLPISSASESIHKSAYQFQDYVTLSQPKLNQVSNVCIGQEKEQLVCAVCGDNAACQHYGVRTCEGCKGFFKRTVQKDAKYVCLSDNNCPVDKRRRNRCQFCRLKKCLAVGMKKEVVRTDLLKGRRGRLPSKHKGHCESPPSPPATLLTTLVRAHVDSSPDLSNLDYSKYDNFCNRNDFSWHMSCIDDFYKLITQSIDIIKSWANGVPGFLDLFFEDQNLLFTTASLELLILRLAYRVQPKTNMITFENGQVYHIQQCFRMCGEWINSIARFGQGLHDMELDISSMSCLEAIVLVTLRHGLRESYQIEELQSRLVTCLIEHCTYNTEAEKKRHFCSRILGKCAQLRTLSQEGLQCFLQHKMGNAVTLPDMIERIYLAGTLPF